jgi:hypothetical protein
MSNDAAMAQGSAVRRAYDLLGVRVGVASDRPELLALLAAMYGRFAAPVDAPAAFEARVWSPPMGRPRIAIGDVEVPLASPPLTDFHAYTILFGEMLRRLEGIFFVHGAVVSDSRRTLVLAGPSGRGKTTLALALMRRGFRLLSDDFAPLRRADGMVIPFAKRVGITRRDGGAPPDGVANPGARWTPFGDKWLVDPADLPGGIDEDAHPPTHLLLLGDAEDPAADARFRVATAGNAHQLEQDLARVPGLTVSRAASPTGRPYLAVDVAGGARVAFHQRCQAEGPNLLLFDPVVAPAGFAAEPRIAPMPRLAAATALLGEILNRTPGSRLLDSASGRVGVLLVELAGHLAPVACARLTVGAADATAAALDRWSAGVQP